MPDRNGKIFYTSITSLSHISKNAENKISELTLKRSRLYSKPDTKLEIEKINNELRELRRDARTCNNIFEDAERIREHTIYVSRLEQEANDKKLLKVEMFVGNRGVNFYASC